MAWVLRRESASPALGHVTKCGAYHSVYPFAILFYSLPAPGLVILRPECRLGSIEDSGSRRKGSQRRMLPAPKLPLTTVLRVVVSEPRLSRLLAFIQRHPFPVGQLPQPGKVPPPDASLGKLLFESLTL